MTGSWFLQIIGEGAAIALFVMLAVFLPALPFQLFFLVLVAYVFWALLRNPRFFYRRLIHPVLWAMLLPSLSESTLDLFGYATGDAGGVVRLALRLDPGASPELLAGVIALFVIGDLATGLIFERVRSGRSEAVVVSAAAFTERDGRYDFTIDLVVRAPAKSGLAVAGAQVRAGPWSRWLDASLLPPPPPGSPARVPLGDEAYEIEAGKSASITLEGAADPGSRYGRWLSFWSTGWRALRYSHGTVQLQASPQSPENRATFTFRLNPPEARPAVAAEAPPDRPPERS